MKRSGPLRRHTPLARGTNQLRRTRLAPKSQKRIAQDDEYAQAKSAAFLRDLGRCQAETLVPDVACGGTVDPHHVWPQGQYPERRCDTDAMLTVCRHHHTWIHEHNPEARKLGLLV